MHNIDLKFSAIGRLLWETLSILTLGHIIQILLLGLADLRVCLEGLLYTEIKVNISCIKPKLQVFYEKASKCLEAR